MCTKFHCSAKENFLMWCFLEIIIYLLIVDQCVEDADSTWLPLLLFFVFLPDIRFNGRTPVLHSSWTSGTFM